MSTAPFIFHPVHMKEPVRPEDAGRIGVEDLLLNNFEIQDRDIIIVASKVVSILEGRCVKLDSVIPSKKSRKIAEVYGTHPGLIELIRQEGQVMMVLPAWRLVKNKKYQDILRSCAAPGLTEEQWQYVLDFYCTYRWGVKKFGLLADNAGIDCTNVPEGYAVMLPTNPTQSATELRAAIRKRTGKETAVIITDTFGSGSTLLGSFDLPIGYSGIDFIERNWGRIDVFGRGGTGGFSNYLYPIASMAGILGGGSDEGTPIIVLRGFPYKDERPEDIGKNVLRVPTRYIWKGVFWTIMESVRYFFVWLRA
jgi:coenzyme F420-0:L-glutamate ligase / coenzyme F420-1:gamma-L-glutamate ligase